MHKNKKARTALISVFNKEGLDPIVRKLHDLGITICSTGGTAAFIEQKGIPVTLVESITSYPSILGGRVKTLHPKIFGGILNRQDLDSDQKQMKKYNIPQIDIVVVDLYPFEETIASGAEEQDIIEKIDIGGISLIRAAAKNFNDVICVASMHDYSYFLDLLNKGDGVFSQKDRKKLACNAFNISSHYDTSIHHYFSEDNETLKLSVQERNILRYGENPHQKGAFFGPLDSIFKKYHGKELSYNNLLDIDAAVNIISEFVEDAPTFAILKHNNACGLATRNTLIAAYKAALAGDPISAFGGVLISNTSLDETTANEINTLFCEVVIAPDFNAKALEILKKKKNRIILKQKQIISHHQQIRSCLNGYLVQEKDDITDNVDMVQTVTHLTPNENEINDLLFASKICKHTKSNTIVLAKNGQLIASGTGQTSRVDALRQAIHKAQAFGFNLEGAAMASDAFFPFPDCVEIAHRAGIRHVIQPGGSIKDQLSIDYCNSNNMVMVMTGVRHFKH